MEIVSLPLHERLLLLVLDDQKGTSRSIFAEPALAGALLLDTLQAGLAQFTNGRLTVTAGTPPPDGVLGEVVTAIVNEPRPQGPRWWVDHLPGRIKPFLPRLASRLVETGVLTEQQHKFLGLFASSPRFPERDRASAAGVRERLRAVLADDRAPEGDDAVLASLVAAAGLLGTVVDKHERRHAQQRAEELGKGSELGDAVSGVIKAAHAAVIAATAAATSAATVATGT